MSEDGSKPKDDSSSLQNKISRIFGHGQEKLRTASRIGMQERHWMPY